MLSIIKAPLRALGIGSSAPVVPVLRLSGAIGAVSRFSPGLSLASMAGPIDRAFNMAGADAVALCINSPGGAAVQSRMIHDRIRQLSAEKGRRVYAFVEDVAASGGYMLACAADEINADASSIVGSIGVIYAGFGFQEMIRQIGVERRVHTAGERKLMLDPFQPENADDIARLKEIQRLVHDEFIALVKARRGAAIAAHEHELFTGEFWSGRQATALGLVDGLGDVRGRMRQLFGPDVRLRPITPERGLFRRRGAPGVSGGMAAIGESLLATAEQRLAWARYGL